MWNNTLFLFFSDNGGPAFSTANNFPLRGGKTSYFEGGIRVVSFLSGGYLPQNQSGTTRDGLMHIADWYTTFSHLAGVDHFDHLAAQSSLPPVDGLNQWDLITGVNLTSPRTEIPVSGNALIQFPYKLLTGSQEKGNYWTGPLHPNISMPQGLTHRLIDCSQGCLFDVVNDPTEHSDISQDEPDLVTAMTARLHELQRSFWQNSDRDTGRVLPTESDRDNEDFMAKMVYKGFMGPWQDLTSDFLHRFPPFHTPPPRKKHKGKPTKTPAKGKATTTPHKGKATTTPSKRKATSTPSKKKTNKKPSQKTKAPTPPHHRPSTTAAAKKKKVTKKPVTKKPR